MFQLLFTIFAFGIIMSASSGEEIVVGGESPVSSSAPNRAALAAKRVKPQLTKDLAEIGCKIGDPIFMRVFKEEGVLEMWLQPSNGAKFKKFRTYKIARFSGRLGPKQKQGDMQAPEGFYYVPRSKMNPRSSFHLSFDLGYPNAYDRAYGRTGDFLMVHGNQVSIGCYAMTDANIEEIYTLADEAMDHGQDFFRVHCFPFRMTDKRMSAAAESGWRDFWVNLREGYNAFEETGIPPNITVNEKRYIIEKRNTR
ncbi:MAG: murein L,D-transpeptidase family protein [Verrucomicrobiota bacterium]